MPTEIRDIECARRHLAAGRYDAAEDAARRSLSAGRRPAPAYRLLADISRARGRPSQEAAALEGLIASLEGDAHEDTACAWGRLAVLRFRQGDIAEAAEALQNATAAAPSVFEYHRDLARTRFAAQDLKRAEISAEDLLLRFPREAFSHTFAGHVHKANGRRSEATQCYRRALALNAESGEALYNLVDLVGPDLDQPIERLAMELADQVSLPIADRINAAFAAARISDRRGQHGKSFEYLRRANDLARDELAGASILYDPAAVETRVAETIAACPAQSFEMPLGGQPIDLIPIFVVGLPRSGTTLIEQILCSHSEVEAGGELLAARRSELEFRRTREAAGRAGPIEPSDPVDTSLLEDARERYIDALLERGLSGPQVVDKLPANFEIVGFLRLMFPNAPIVHAVRDLRATGFSLYNANFGAHEPWYHDLNDIAHYLIQYRRLMSYWRSVVPAPCVDIVYEDLVSDPTQQIPKLLAAVGLDCEPSCLEFYRHARAILTASHAQVQQPAYTDAIDKWRAYADWLGPVGRLPSR